MKSHHLLGTRDASDLLEQHVPTGTWRRYLRGNRAGETRAPMIPFIRGRGHVYYREADLRAFLNRMLNDPPQGAMFFRFSGGDNAPPTERPAVVQSIVTFLSRWMRELMARAEIRLAPLT
jgi:hypothetical protein